MKRLSALMGKKKPEAGAGGAELSPRLFLAMSALVARTALQPQVLEEALTAAGKGGQKQAVAETVAGVWQVTTKEAKEKPLLLRQAGADPKLFMMGATRAVFAELAKTADQPAETLRHNGLGSKILGLFLTRSESAVSWLCHVLQPLIKRLEEETETGEDINVAAEVDQVLDALLALVPSLPRDVKYLCHAVAEHTRGTAAEGIALRSLFMLRFLVPAVMLPAAHGIVPADTVLPKPLQMALTGVAKHLQLLTNGKLEEQREQAAKLDRILLLSTQDEVNFEDMTRVDALTFNFYQVPKVSSTTLVDIMTMLSQLTNDNYESFSKRAKHLVSCIGNADFDEETALVPRQSLGEPLAEAVSSKSSSASSLPLVSSSSGSTRVESSVSSSLSGVKERVYFGANYTDSESDDDSPLCSFIRSFLRIPDMMFEDFDGGWEEEAHTSEFARQNQLRRQAKQNHQRAPLIRVTRDNDNGEPDSGSGDEGDDGGFPWLTDNKSDSDAPRGDQIQSPSLSPRSSMVKHVLSPTVSAEIWGM